VTVTRYNDKQKIRDLYDRTSPYYQSLWGEHIHHGYWISGKETKEKAQIQLIEHLAQAAGLEPAARSSMSVAGLAAARSSWRETWRQMQRDYDFSHSVEMARKAAAATA